jgi:hypothetical protein
MAKTISEYYTADDGATGAIPQARKAVAELPLERILNDRDACERETLRRYELPVIIPEGEAATSVDGDAGVAFVSVNQPVKPDEKIADLLQRIDEPWQSTPYHLAYSEGRIHYKIRAGEPFFIKEEVRHSLELIMRQEIEPRNNAVMRENERLRQAVAQALDDRLTEVQSVSEHKRKVKEALNR